MKRYLDQAKKRVDELKAKIIQIPGEKTSKLTACPKPPQPNI